MTNPKTADAHSEETTVYRVQSFDGRGPWRPGFTSRWVEDRDDLMFLQPWFVEFGDVRKLIPTGMASGSACRSIEQLKRWFTPREYRTLLYCWYKAVAMEATVLVGSSVQCVILREKPLNEDVEPFELYSHKELYEGKI